MILSNDLVVPLYSRMSLEHYKIFMMMSIMVVIVIRHQLSGASNFAYSYPFLCSMVCHLSHSCTLLKLFNRFTCHLADTLTGSSDALF